MYKPVIALMCAATMYGLFGVFSKMIGLSFGVFAQGWARYLVSSLIVFVYLFLQKQLFKISRADIPKLLVWGISDAASMILMFVAFNNIYVGTAYFLLYVGIIISGYLFGYLLHKEKFTVRKVIAATLSVLGMALLLSVSWQTQGLIYLLLAFVAGLAGGYWYTAMATFKKYTNMQLVLVDAVILFAISFIIAALKGEHIPSFAFNISWLGVGLFAVTDIFAVGLTLYGFKRLESHLGNLIMPLEMVAGAIFGLIFFHQILPFTAWLGGLLILCAALLPHLPLRINVIKFSKEIS